jgi:hypothetical protein
MEAWVSLAVLAIVLGVIMLAGVPVTLILTGRDGRTLPGCLNRWQAESVSLAASGAIVAVLSRASSGQSPAGHDIIVGVAITLFVTALLCSLAGAAAATRSQRRGPVAAELASDESFRLTD